MDQYYNYCHLDKYFSDTYEKKYPLMDQYYCHPDKYFSDTYEKIPKEEVVMINSLYTRSFIYGIFASKETEASIWYFKNRKACNAEGRPVHNPPATVKTNGHTTNYPLLYTMMHLMDQYYNYCHLDKYFSDTYEKKYPLMDQYYSEEKVSLNGPILQLLPS